MFVSHLTPWRVFFLCVARGCVIAHVLAEDSFLILLVTVGLRTLGSVNDLFTREHIMFQAKKKAFVGYN